MWAVLHAEGDSLVVFRWAGSGQCRMLEVAGKKLKLETMVIERGQFVQEKGAGAQGSGSGAKVPSVIAGEELEALLRPKQSEHQERVQSAEISDANLDLLVDRSDMLPQADPKAPGGLPAAGPGWEVVASAAAQSSLLSSIS